MKYDLMLGGVGGQGILSIAFVVDNAAMESGLHFKQSEVHGMAQRGGAVSSHLRISDKPIFSDIVSCGGADMLLSVEPMEALRYRDYLAAGGVVVAGVSPVVNIPDYPAVDELVGAIVSLENAVLFDSEKIAREAGSSRAQNMVALGAASEYLPLDNAVMEKYIAVLFGKKGEKIINVNLDAYRYGQANGAFFSAMSRNGADPVRTLRLMAHLRSASIEPDAAPDWVAVIASGAFTDLENFWAQNPRAEMSGERAVAKRIIEKGIAAMKGEG
jgi:indolepyruvate ferredoxin oxidoreductase, beta subunit